MTFLEEIKDELENVREKEPKSLASELRAVILFGAAAYKNGALLGVERFTMAKRVVMLLRKSCGVTLEERVDENAESYKFYIPESVLTSLFLTADGHSVTETEDLETEAESKRAFVRGAFLISGSASNPEKSYRMEIFSESEEKISKICGILSFFEVEIKHTKRKNLYVAYTQKCEAEADLLRVAGSSAALFRVFEAKAVKDKRNDINRITNCDFANADRAADSSVQQISAIEKIKNTRGLETLRPKLYEAAMLRLENEAASTAELANMANISKSAMYSRLSKIVEAANGIDE